MKLSRLIEGLTDPGGQPLGGHDGIEPDREIGSIHYRAQDVRPGGLFVAIPGLVADGHDFIGTALSRGAAAIVAQKAVAAEQQVIIVRDTRKALGELAARFYGNPAQQLFMIGITGTNGKTTTAYLLESMLSAAGFTVGVIGPINYRYSGQTFDNPVTTPESADLQRILAEMKNSGITHVIMEVSSHGIHLQRIRGCRYDIGIFTNLTQDHLDFHGTMAAYWNCKQKLFTEYLRPKDGVAVINSDDARGADLAGRLHPTPVTVGRASRCKIKPMDEQYDLSGITAEISTPAGAFQCRSPLVGRHNLENILCAVGAAVAMGLPVEPIKSGIEQVATVPGRLEPVENDRRRFVFIDYAHTPDALNNTLAALRSVTKGRIICVFGCGGDRDKGKRPQMGEIAGNGSDLAIITSDNPRREDPLAIVDEVLAGAKKTSGYFYAPETLGSGFEKTGFTVEPDRRAAIELAVSASRPGDTILIAGKGHETYQVLADRTIDFDDRTVARQALGA